jgi:hypothetical protein
VTAAAMIGLLSPLKRGPGVVVPGLVPAAGWVDNLALVAGVAKAYPLPIDGLGIKAGVFRITAVAQVYFNFYGTAVAPGSDETDGLASAKTDAQQRPYLMTVPQGATVISFVSVVSQVITIEAWAGTDPDTGDENPLIDEFDDLLEDEFDEDLVWS